MKLIWLLLQFLTSSKCASGWLVIAIGWTSTELGFQSKFVDNIFLNNVPVELEHLEGSTLFADTNWLKGGLRSGLGDCFFFLSLDRQWRLSWFSIVKSVGGKQK